MVVLLGVRGGVYLRRIEAAPPRQVKARTSRPAAAGRGDRAERGGWGASRDDLSATTTNLHLRGPLHHASRGPPPPLTRGRIILPHSRDASSHPSFVSRFKKALPKASPHKEGRRSADRRNCLGAASADAAAVSAETAGLSALHRGARQGGRIHHWLSSSSALPETWLHRRYPLSPVSSQPRSAETGRSAGRWGPRAARARLARPRAGTALAPPSRSHPERALRWRALIRQYVTEIGTDVKGCRG